jgi:hypothetical protein
MSQATRIKTVSWIRQAKKKKEKNQRQETKAKKARRFTCPGLTDDGGDAGAEDFPESGTPRTLRSRGGVESWTWGT